MTAVNYKKKMLLRENILRKPQKRSIDTRKKILDVTREMVVQNGYASIRTEEVVAAAGVAKGTLFAHFGDKDQLLYTLMCEEIDGAIGSTVLLVSQEKFEKDDFVDALIPLMKLLSREKIIFDLFQHFSGVSTGQFDIEIGDDCKEYKDLLTRGVSLLQADGKVRGDLPAHILGEGCLAFLIQAVSFVLGGQYSNLAQAEKEFRYKLNSWF